MARRLISAAAVAAACATLPGCISFLSVKKATDESEGIRYFLPQPFIKVTPKLDGTVEVEQVLLPDTSNEYAITASSLLGNYTIDVNRTAEGFLGTVNFNADSTGIAKQLIESAGNVRAAQVDAKAAKQKADADAVKAAADKAASDLAAAEKAQKEAQVQVDIAERKLRILQNVSPPPADQVLAAQLALEEAVVRRDAASAAYNGLAAKAAAANTAAANDKETKKPAAPEPVFYKVVMPSKNSVKLVQAFPQMDRITWNVPKVAAKPADFLVLPANLIVSPQRFTRAVTATVRANHQLTGAAFDSFEKPPPGPLPFNPVFALHADGMTIDIQFPKDSPPGEYIVRGSFTRIVDDKPKAETSTIRVRVQ